MPRLSVLPLTRVFLIVLLFLTSTACSGTARSNPADRRDPANFDPPVSIATKTAKGPPARPLASATPAPTPLPRIQAPIAWYVRGPAPEDLPRVNEQLNRLLDGRGFNARVEIHPMEPKGYEQQMADLQKTGAAWDLVSLDRGAYPGWATGGSLLPLTGARDPRTGQVENRLESQAPRLLASLPPAVWKAVQVSGKINAIPNQGVWVRPRGISIRADVVRALGLQPDLDELNSFQDLSPLLEKINRAISQDTLKGTAVDQADNIRQVFAQPDMLQPEAASYDPLVMPFVVRCDDPQAKIVNWYQTPEFRALADMRRQWQAAGYGPEDPLTPEQWAEGYRSGRYVADVGSQVWPGSALEQHSRFGYEWIDQPLSPGFLTSQAVFASLTGLNGRLIDDPERLQRALMFVEWTHSDPQIYNLLAYGVEAQHWRWVDQEKKIIALEPGSRYHPDEAFLQQLGDRTLAYAAASDPPGLWDAVRKANGSAAASPALGFVFDPRPVAAEMAAVRGLTPELVDPLANGQAANVEKGINALIKSLDAAGLPAIQAELERQFAAWRAGQS